MAQENAYINIIVEHKAGRTVMKNHPDSRGARNNGQEYYLGGQGYVWRQTTGLAGKLLILYGWQDGRGRLVG